MSNASVSAILFCYNEEKYIGKVIQSLIDQTYPIQKIIIADDFSDDETVSIIECYAKLDNRIVLLKNAYTKGKVWAYQTALKAVQTEFFFVIGSDDEADKNLVMSSLDFIKNNSCPFFFHSAILIDENSNQFEGSFISHFDPISCYFYHKTGGFIFAKRSVIEKIIPFPSDLEFEDWYTVLTLFEAYGFIKTCIQPYVRYRIHSGSSSQSSRYDWKRRKELLIRDLRFLAIMKTKLVGQSSKHAIAKSICFRQRLLKGLPMTGSSLKVTFLFLKTYISITLARFVSLVR
jgi:teichuronic acid biosynthesis glycosyltransferase TuaG